MRGGDITRSIILVMLAAAAIAAVALVGLHSSGGPDAASAHVTGSPHMEIDLVKDGSTWCNPVDATASRAADNTAYQIAICLTDSEAAPAGFQFEVVYDSALNTCTNVATGDVTSLDDNPDANAGSTTFSTPNLGTGWDCNIMDVLEPLCDYGGSMGRALIACMCVEDGCATLPSGPGVSAPLAVLTLSAANVGVDNLMIENAAAAQEDLSAIITKCTRPANACVGATVNVHDWTTTPMPTPGGVPPTGTPGAGVTPGAGATPAPSGPEATAAAVAQGTPLSALTPPPAGTTTPGAKKTPSGSPTARPSATPSEEKGGGEGGGTNAAVIAGIVIGALVVVGGAGWFAWRRLRLR